jgi:hypothetical protein
MKINDQFVDLTSKFEESLALTKKIKIRSISELKHYEGKTLPWD